MAVGSERDVLAFPWGWKDASLLGLDTIVGVGCLVGIGVGYGSDEATVPFSL